MKTRNLFSDRNAVARRLRISLVTGILLRCAGLTGSRRFKRPKYTPLGFRVPSRQLPLTSLLSRARDGSHSTGSVTGNSRPERWCSRATRIRMQGLILLQLTVSCSPYVHEDFLCRQLAYEVAACKHIDNQAFLVGRFVIEAIKSDLPWSSPAR
jgi:hypothetical protein